MNIPSLWILRVGDGENLRNSKYTFWGVKRGKNGSIKSIVTKMLIGDILCFITSKQYGGKIIGMCEYTGFYDRKDEPLLQINTKTNLEQQWTGDDSWDIQIHYNKFYVTEKQNISACIQCGAIIMNYKTFKDKIERDLFEHYKNFKFYAEPKAFQL